MLVKEVANKLKEADNFIITSHINLEGDALGSEIALYVLLKKLGKKVKIINETKPPAYLQFLPFLEQIEKACQDRGNKFQLAVVLDTPNMERLGKSKSLILKTPFIINIDHHISNQMFGHINWVDSHVSSVGELIYHLYQAMGIEINYDVAVAIYTAIVTDSGFFRFLGTNPDTHRIVAKLLEKGVDPNYIYSKIYENFTVEKIKILAQALLTIQAEEDIGLVWFEISKDFYAGNKVKDEALEGVIDYGRSIKDVKLALLFQDLGNGIIKVGFRSKTSKIDVNQIAFHFGGGGHPMASGCKIKGDFKQVKNKVLSFCRQYLRNIAPE